jgi:NIPSNAP
LDFADGGFVKRREFMAGSVAASAAALAGSSKLVAQSAGGAGREFYELRKYHMQSGPQTKLMDGYLEGALIPALNKMGVRTVGVFNATYGETPTMYVLMPSMQLETLVTAELLLAKDAAYMKAAAAFWSAPAVAAPYVRIESKLMVAFEGWPKLVLPTATAKNEKRIFQLRTYESPTNGAHARKVEMMNSGEAEAFKNSGCTQVFYGDTLIGPSMPNLTYMLTFPDIDALNVGWEKFRADPTWKKLSGSPRYNYEAIVSNITNLVLTPAPYSQI